ncbi:MAG: YihY/virulence factor BrkB family protein [Muribaculaceae bacterium]|nr:YihY/virulence factor BrkB family protein [Muribaculaceae bacterium]
MGLKETATVITDRLTRWWNYCAYGVWSDTRTGWRVTIIKTLNLSVRSFLSKDVQTAACGMAFRTLLATIPALALIFAVGRGFGLVPVLQDALLNMFPAQRTAISESFVFVDSYLSKSSEGLFVGVGILVLLWTLVSLMSSVESAFNKIWGIKHGRTLWRQITDYTAMFLILPVLMVASTGISVVMSSTLQNLLPMDFVTPLAESLLDLSAVVLTWLTFAGAYKLVPNTKVNFGNALIAGILAGTAYEILQWLFVSGQLYVSKYNAIYGSVAFLPLLMIWMQLVWVITLAGAVICFSSQNIFRYSFSDQISEISPDYRTKVMLAVLAVIVQDYDAGRTPRDDQKIALDYKFPLSLVSEITDRLVRANIIYKALIDGDNKGQTGFVPAVEPEKITVGFTMRRLEQLGSSDFIPDFGNEFATVVETVDTIKDKQYDETDKIHLTNLTINKQ